MEVRAPNKELVIFSFYSTVRSSFILSLQNSSKIFHVFKWSESQHTRNLVSSN